MAPHKIHVVGSYLVAMVMDTARIPTKGETLMASNFRTAHGGKGSNQAVQAAMLNGAVNFIGRIGNDNFGAAFTELLKTENVGDDFVFVSDDLPTGAGFIICSADGHNLITIDTGAILRFSRADIDLAISSIHPNEIVLAQFEIPSDTALYALSEGRKRGAFTILNPAPATNLSSQHLDYIDVLTPNETEARICLGLAPDTDITDEEAGRKLLATGCRNVIVTLGDRGCLWVHADAADAADAAAGAAHGAAEFFPACRVDRVVDSTGAGDAFNAGLAVALAEGRSIPEAIGFANAAGALSVTKADTIPSYHYRPDLDRLMSEQPLLLTKKHLPI
jgi:ribokinase